MKRGFCAVLGACVLLFAGADLKDKVVTAERFVIVDVDGHERARLGTISDGSPTLSFKDKNGDVNFILLQGSDGQTAFVLSDAAKKDRLRFGVDGKGSPFFMMLDDTEKERLGLAVEQGLGVGVGGQDVERPDGDFGRAHGELSG